ncbi:MAG: MaoC/PaaZ C-terminal domain-containing protein [Dehalococcoidia bacterium]|nr:MaoC/PaaZ C-terminal domain-containing protein [Dehalococcoidia bacterium]MDP6783157.1 MaoC/PaaZ C-terminal domain-containing protein [Dehalococcoidia bacterium]
MQPFFGDVAIGQELPPVTKRPNLMQMVRWAGASENLHPVHYDPEVIRASGVPDALVHGRLKAAFVTEVVTDWMGERGTLRKLNIRLLGMDFPNQELVCRGKVTGKPETSGEPVVECEIWLENPGGEVTVRGTALVSLPRYSGS